MKSTSQKKPRSFVSAKLTSKRAVKISAIEGSFISSRMADTIELGKLNGWSGDRQRSEIKAKFSKKQV